MSDPRITCLLVTYQRTDLAVRTVRGIEDHLAYDNFDWHIADDGSDPEHRRRIGAAIGRGRHVSWSNAERRGVGRSMNLGAREAFERSDFVLWLEDDWELREPFDPRPAIALLESRDDLGMVRLGYISPGIRGELIGGGNRLWWQLEKGPTYTFTGHASLRHKRFWLAYGPYEEDLTPGETELWMCGNFNNRSGPGIVVPAWLGEWGAFAHIGGQSLNNVRPEMEVARP